MQDPEWNDLRVILALGRSGSIAGAARALSVDDSTVSRRLAAAEKAFGAVLIVRGGSKFAFTAAGKAVLAAAEAMETAVSAAGAAVRASKTELAGVVKISCAPSALHFLLPFPQEVRDNHPGLHVELMSTREVIDLAKGDADIALRGVRPTDLGLIVRHQFEWGFALYAAPSYLREYGSPASHAELSRHQLVRYDESFRRASFATWIEPFVSETTPNIRVDSVDMAQSMIAAGRGIGVLSAVQGDADPRLNRVFPEVIDLMRGWIVYHESSRGSKRVEVVIEALIEYFIERRHVMSGHSSN
jgi:DNA-binding transcriptional LysR family regulator